MIAPRTWMALIVAGVLAVMLAGSHWQAYNMGAISVQSSWDAEKVIQADQAAVLATEAAATTDKLQTSADQIRKSKNAQIARLNADLAAAIERLSDRPARPGAIDLPTVAGSGSNASCTGAQLYREDGQFLARESARANRLLADLAQCQDAYGKARDSLR